ncbi:MAG: carboxypeptidase-like regulatory domain-containing protein [Planctomycetaceae bacterium]|jgi:hypothetical protein|nr:carboxypeptidase-like regulatory domain-containing protein [Planctomycetaceae bacterium]
MKHYITLTLLLWVVSGCSGGGLAGLYPVKGKVIDGEGKPLAEVAVICVPLNPSPETRSASALTAADGTFSLRTLKTDDGAFPGEYQVTVCKFIDSITGEEKRELLKLGVEEVEVETQNALPPKYAVASTSDITLAVKKGRNPLWEIVIPEGLHQVIFSPKSTFAGQKPKSK